MPNKGGGPGGRALSKAEIQSRRRQKLEAERKKLGRSPPKKRRRRSAPATSLPPVASTTTCASLDACPSAAPTTVAPVVVSQIADRWATFCSFFSPSSARATAPEETPYEQTMETDMVMEEEPATVLQPAVPAVPAVPAEMHDYVAAAELKYTCAVHEHLYDRYYGLFAVCETYQLHAPVMSVIGPTQVANDLARVGHPPTCVGSRPRALEMIKQLRDEMWQRSIADGRVWTPPSRLAAAAAAAAAAARAGIPVRPPQAPAPLPTKRSGGATFAERQDKLHADISADIEHHFRSSQERSAERAKRRCKTTVAPETSSRKLSRDEIVAGFLADLNESPGPESMYHGTNRKAYVMSQLERDFVQEEIKACVGLMRSRKLLCTSPKTKVEAPMTKEALKSKHPMAAKARSSFDKHWEKIWWMLKETVFRCGNDQRLILRYKAVAWVRWLQLLEGKPRSQCINIESDALSVTTAAAAGKFWFDCKSMVYVPVDWFHKNPTHMGQVTFEMVQQQGHLLRKWFELACLRTTQSTARMNLFWFFRLLFDPRAGNIRLRSDHNVNRGDPSPEEDELLTSMLTGGFGLDSVKAMKLAGKCPVLYGSPLA